MSELIKIQDLNKKYGKKQVLKDVNLTLHGGQIVGLLGPNGSGKTTLIKVLNGLLKEYDGDVQIDQQAIGIHSKKIISYLPDEPYFENWMTTSDALNLFVDMYDDFDLNKALSLMERMDIEKKVKIKELSKGMKEKFQLILVMSRKAKIYILDEPLNYLDIFTRMQVQELLLIFKPTVLFVEHDKYFCDQIKTKTLNL